MTQPGEQVTAWRPPLPGVDEVVHARFVTHAYPRHTHDVWTVIRVDTGDIRFALDGRSQGTAAAHVTVLPPHVAHDGRAGPSGRFTKQVLYLDGRHLPERLIGPAVDAPTTADPTTVQLLGAVHRLLRCAGEALAAEVALTRAVTRLHDRLSVRGDRSDHGDVAPDHRAAIAEHARALIDSRVVEGITVAELAAATGATTAGVTRAFTTTFRLPPHTYLVGRRVGLARRLLLDGVPPAQAAVAAGFVDQAHLTRHFRRAVGSTPARYARSRPA